MHKRVLKKFQIKTIFKIPESISLDHVDIWLQDEARFGQQNTTTRLWAKKGIRTRTVKQQQFEYTYLSASVCVTNGRSEAPVVPYVNKEMILSHLQQISDRTPNNRHGGDIDADFNNENIIPPPIFQS